MMIDQNFNLLIDVDYSEGEILKFYVPQPQIAEIKAISRILGYFYKVTSSQTEAVPVIVTDWERLVDESLSSLSSELKNNVAKALDNLFTRMLDSCSVIKMRNSEAAEFFDYTTTERSKYLDDAYVIDRFKGTALFILALLRYSERSMIQDTLSDFITSATLLELQSSLKKSAKELKAGQETKSQVSLKTTSKTSPTPTGQI